jgi:ankyrin repeat protein
MVDGAGVSALHHTCFKGNLKFSEFLIAHGANANALDRAGQSPLANACFKGDDALVSLLLRSGASTKFSSGTATPLHHCAAQGHHACLRLLLSPPTPGGSPTNINLVDREGSTPLHKAAYFGHVLCVEQLIKHGADVTIQDGTLALCSPLYLLEQEKDLPLSTKPRFRERPMYACSVCLHYCGRS